MCACVCEMLRRGHFCLSLLARSVTTYNDAEYDLFNLLNIVPNGVHIVGMEAKVQVVQ